MNPEDYRSDLYVTAGGPGAANTVSRRLTHLPTGISVSASKEGQHFSAEENGHLIARLEAAVEAEERLIQR